jgi:hypothetical protein
MMQRLPYAPCAAIGASKTNSTGYFDIAFREDDYRIRKDYGPRNFAVLWHIALNLLKQDTTAQFGIQNKRLQAAWDENYLLALVAH